MAADESSDLAVLSQLKKVVRCNYSNPPTHGASIVETVLGSDELSAQWKEELGQMRDRINGMRKLFVETMNSLGVERDYAFIQQQNGMFSFSGLNPIQVDQLKNEHSIYIVGSGRINVAGISESNVGRLCRAIQAVL